MAKYVKVGGTWKQVSPDVDSNIYANIKVGGSWKDITAAYIKVNGTWRQYWNYSAYIVPNVVGQNYLTAQTAITGSGNTVGTLTTLANAQGATPQNDKTVASQTVAAGKYITQQTVGLSYYVFTYVTVPNIVGQTVSTGQTLVQNSGNTWGTGSYYNNAQGATAGNNNTILSQSPAAGQYVTAQTVNYGYYLYTVPTPSAPTVSLVGSNPSSSPTSFSFTVSYGANTTSAIAYYGPQGNPTQTSLGSVSNGGTATASGLSPNTSYQFTAYAYNTVNVNTLGNQTTGPVAGNVGSVTTANLPAPGYTTLSANSSTSSSINVTASMGSNTTIYYIYYGTSNPPGTYFGAYSSTTTFNITGLSASTTYYIMSQPYNSTVPGSTYTITGSTAAATVTPGTPSPSGFYSGGTAYFSWANTANTAYWEIDYYYAPSSSPYAWSSVNPPTTSWSFGVSAGQTIYFYIRSVSTDGVTRSGWASASVSAPAAVTVPTASVTNTYNGDNNPWSWTLRITHTGGSVPTTYNGYFSESASSSGPDASSTYFSGTWTAGSGGTQTVTRNSYTYSWARWTNIYVGNSAGSSNASGSPTPYQ